MPVAANSLANLERRARGRSSPNKMQATIKDMIVTALNTVGGAQYLARQAEENPVAFMGLVGRVLPLQLQSDPNSVVTLFSAHLLAATAVSEQLHSQPIEPPTISGNVEPVAQGNLLDAPLPKE